MPASDPQPEPVGRTDATRNGVDPDVADILEDDFPIDCVACGADLAGLGDKGECPKCAESFDRRERLLDLHGPEAFLQEKPVDVRKPPREWFPLGAIVLTVIALFAVPFSKWLADGGVISPDRRVFVVFLFVAAAMEWVRASRARRFEQESDDELK